MHDPSSLSVTGAEIARHHTLAIVGAGIMGRAIASGLVRNAVMAPEHLYIASRAAAKARALADELGAHTVSSDEACRQADIVILCVKPADVPPLLMELTTREALVRQTLLVSIAAGVTTATIESLAGPAIPVVRAMPNTPCRIGRGMTVVSGGTHATAEHVAIARRLFASVGRCLVLDERRLDAVTAVAASGPAFIYLIIEALADGGVMCGLPRDVATELAAQMTAGAADMVLSSDRHPAQLRDDVTTPGGCTIAGLLALEERHVRSALAHAIQTTTRVAAGLGR